MDSNTSPKPASNQPKTHWAVILLVLVSLVSGFIGGALAIRWYDVKLGISADTETQRQVVSSESAVITEIAENLSPSVVSISVETIERGFFSDLFTQEGAGTGIIVSEDGLVLTNRHVIPENTTSVSLVATDGTVYDDVDVVDRDPLNDIAFLQINGASGLKPAELGDSDSMRVGDKVIAIGNALGVFENTVTTGIISGTGRPIVAGDGQSSEQLRNLFQTDAAINPGNSGGPLVNIQGEVIGVNTAVAGGNAENIGFAIPINDVKPVLASVLDNGEINRPFLGVRYIMLTEAIAEELELVLSEGAYITASNNVRAVLPGSPADEAGLEDGDIIIRINADDITTDDPLAEVIAKYQPGQSISVTYVRDGSEVTTQLTLAELPRD